MAKWSGTIAYSMYAEETPGCWEPTIIEKSYKGEVYQDSRRLFNSGEANDSVRISNRISVIADPFAITNFHQMIYTTYMGTKWKIEDAVVNFPRITLTLGGQYNGPSIDASRET